MQQWQEKIIQFLDIEEVLPDIEKTRGRKKKRSKIGQLGGSRNDLHNIIDVVVFNSALSGHDVKDFVKDYGLVIVDECHHVAASSFENVLSQVTGKKLFGLSATPVRQDGKHPMLTDSILSLHRWMQQHAKKPMTASAWVTTDP
jgi:superfamily II DNA or RNA helicase